MQRSLESGYWLALLTNNKMILTNDQQNPSGGKEEKNIRR